jgi:DAPG hydrolase PhiG domain
MDLTEADRLLDPAPMSIETGVERLDSGALRVAVRTDMPRCTGRMLEWWFQSAPDSGRYAWWHPHDHVSSEWREWSPGRHIGSTHVVKERLNGGEVQSLLINFIDPVEMFNADAWARAQASGDASVAICATLGTGPDPLRDEQGRPADGRMVHLGRENDFGLVLRSTFWLGSGVDAPAEVLRELLPQELGLALMVHSHTEFKYLSHILPALYAAEAEPDTAAVPW